MAFHSFRASFSLIALAFIASSCLQNSKSNVRELAYRGEHYPDNVLIIRDDRGYFGDKAAMPRHLDKLYKNDIDCVDVGLVSFSLNTQNRNCGNYQFFYKKIASNDILVRGVCVKTDLWKCYSDSVSPTSVEYVLETREMPRRFKLEVAGLFEDNFILTKLSY